MGPGLRAAYYMCWQGGGGSSTRHRSTQRLRSRRLAPSTPLRRQVRPELLNLISLVDTPIFTIPAMYGQAFSILYVLSRFYCVHFSGRSHLPLSEKDFFTSVYLVMDWLHCTARLVREGRQVWGIWGWGSGVMCYRVSVERARGTPRGADMWRDYGRYGAPPPRRPRSRDKYDSRTPMWPTPLYPFIYRIV